ncbi:glucoamylase family protein [Roseateles sp. LYH14W]|uniref:Glucoamylase family protein n=1 Tax=Pelomonas parva TaxID=3299032 RepID=A0ABW7F1J9_9BURK
MTPLTRRALLAQGAGLALAANLPSWAETTMPLQAADAFLADLERRTFDFFWETTDAKTGLAPDRWPTPSFASIAAVGFALSAYPVGVARGYITRAQARERTLNTLRFFAGLPQGPGKKGVAGYKGFFYHFLDMKEGLRFGRCELSTVDTALLLMGALHAQSFFDGADADEAAIRRLVDEIYGRVDWAWAQVRPPSIGHGWTPEKGHIPNDWKGYNEALMVYLLALGSPTRPVKPEAYDAWLSTYDRDSWGESYGQTLLRFPPLFGHQFTHCWVDFRGIRDAYMRGKGFDYFENSRRATYAQRDYAAANPLGWQGYSAEIWGVSASDGPADIKLTYTTTTGKTEKRRFISYAGRGMGLHDDGTLAPYAAGSSIAFAPEIVIPALMAIKQRYPHTWGRYGFWDAFNPSFNYPDVRLTHGRIEPGKGWVDTDMLGIDQGPLLAMMGNHRGELVWSVMRKNAHLVRGLKRAGFTGGWLG